MSEQIKQNWLLLGDIHGSAEPIRYVNAYTQYIRNNLETDIMIQNSPMDKEVLEGIYELVLETVLNQADSMIIGSNRYPMSLVRGKFMKLNSSHVEYVMDQMKKTTSKIRNIRKYMLTCLFNAPTTIDSFYQAEVNHDFPQYVVNR